MGIPEAVKIAAALALFMFFFMPACAYLCVLYGTRGYWHGFADAVREYGFTVALLSKEDDTNQREGRD